MKSKYSRAKHKAVVLLSGGLDSATTLYHALGQGYSCLCLSFDYGQRHRKELHCANRLACYAGCSHYTIRIELPWKGSSLLDASLPLQRRFSRRQKNKNSIPDTYVPGRNIIFLSFALSCAEATGSEAIFIGANAIDYSGYPDCRPAFYSTFKKAAKAGTRCGLENRPVSILTPLIRMTKAEIVKYGVRLGVPFELTWSCYAGGRRPCGVCDSCFYRRKWV